jgi:hypothetical protein
VLRTLAPLDITGIATSNIPFDLHVLSTPPAFVLSQNQTLREKFVPRLLKLWQILTFQFLLTVAHEQGLSDLVSFASKI